MEPLTARMVQLALMREKDKAWYKRKLVRYAKPFLPRTPRVILGIVEDVHETRETAQDIVRSVHPTTVEAHSERLADGAERVSTAMTVGQIVLGVSRIARKRR